VTWFLAACGWSVFWLMVALRGNAEPPWSTLAWVLLPIWALLAVRSGLNLRRERLDARRRQREWEQWLWRDREPDSAEPRSDAT
jgi:hypothetical protein